MWTRYVLCKIQASDCIEKASKETSICTLYPISDLITWAVSDPRRDRERSAAPNAPVDRARKKEEDSSTSNYVFQSDQQKCPYNFLAIRSNLNPPRNPKLSARSSKTGKKLSKPAMAAARPVEKTSKTTQKLVFSSRLIFQLTNT